MTDGKAWIGEPNFNSQLFGLQSLKKHPCRLEQKMGGTTSNIREFRDFPYTVELIASQTATCHIIKIGNIQAMKCNFHRQPLPAYIIHLPTISESLCSESINFGLLTISTKPRKL